MTASTPHANSSARPDWAECTVHRQADRWAHYPSTKPPATTTPRSCGTGVLPGSPTFVTVGLQNLRGPRGSCVDETPNPHVEMMIRSVAWGSRLRGLPAHLDLGAPGPGPLAWQDRRTRHLHLSPRRRPRRDRRGTLLGPSPGRQTALCELPDHPTAARPPGDRRPTRGQGWRASWVSAASPSACLRCAVSRVMSEITTMASPDFSPFCRNGWNATR